jgi:putative ABC transport system permease protein
MLEVDGRAVPVAQRPEVELRREVFEFFRTMDIPIVRGRAFARQDGPGAPLVAVVNTVLASRVFPGEDAIGRRVRLGSAAPDAPWITIVGVVGSVRHGSLEEAPRPEIYLTYRQNAPVAPFLVVRSAGDAAGLAPAVREAIKATGANPPFDVRTMAEIRSSSMSERTFVLLLVGLFGALGLTMAAIGVYGIITLTAAERVAEVGIRLALGASPVQVLTLILGYAVRLAAIGILIGVGIALAGGPWIGSQLFGVGATDPATYIVVGAALLVVASLAAYLPARRAMRVDPGAVLRPS